MIVAYSYVEASTDDAAAAFATAIEHRRGAVDRYPGFERLELHRDLRDPRRFAIVTWWRTREDLRRYLGSADHRATHAALAEEHRRALGPPRVEIHEIVAR